MSLITENRTSLTPQQIVEILLGSGVTVSNITITGDARAIGSFQEELPREDIGIGITEGVILSSGDIADASGPNTADGTSTNLGQPGDEDLTSLLDSQETNDAVVLEFDFVPENEQFLFEYVFASEEYNEFANSSFNDVFGFFLNGENIALIPGTTTPVSINNINATNNSAFFRNNDFSDLEPPYPFNTEFDGFTTVFAAQSLVTPGVTQRLKIAVADVSDSILDSAVYLKEGSLRTLPPSPDATLNPNIRDVFTIEGSEGFALLKFNLTGVNANTISEVGVFIVDDDEGRIGGVAPGGPDYEKLALSGSRTRTIFSGLPEDPQGNVSRDRLLKIYNVGDRLGFYFIANGTRDQVLFDTPPPAFTEAPQVFFGFPEANENNSDQLQVSESDGVFTLAWDNQLGGDDFSNLVLTAQTLPPSANDNFPEGTRRQGEIQREVIDLSGLEEGDSLTAKFNISSEAAFDNTGGFYRVENVQGTVRDITGELLQPDDPGYAEAAIRNRIVQFDRNGQVSGDTSFDGLLAPFVIANATPEEWLQENPDNLLRIGFESYAYFPYLEANPDKYEHLVLLANNTFGFEDLPLSNTDSDYDDLIIETNLF